MRGEFGRRSGGFFCASKWHFLVLPMDMRVAVKEGFLSSASFVSREQPPPSPIKHVGMEAFGRLCCVSCVRYLTSFFWVCWLVVARGLRSDLLAFVTPPRSFGLTGLSLCWCCLRWTFRSLEHRARGRTLLRNLEKKSGVRILRSSFASPDRSIRYEPSRSCNLLAATLNLDPTRLPLARLRDSGDSKFETSPSLARN